MKAIACLSRLFVHTRNYFILPFLLLSSVKAEATTWYVKPGGIGTGSGSWVNAAASTSLAAIIAGAASGDQVWVVGSAGGTTYYPTTTTTRTIAFVLKTGVAVYGGFTGTETLLSQRNASTNITILSGDIGTAGLSTDNSYNVVVSSGNTGVTILDGFTIKNGYANGAGQYSTGAGIYNSATTVTYSNCTILSNTAASNGGGVYITGSGNVTYSNCTFKSNSTTVAASTTTGGGAAFCNGGTASFIGCTFSTNSSTSEGGAVFSTSTIATFTNCTLTHNSSSNDGGGVYLYNSGTYLFSSCAFDTCSAAGNGGGAALNTLSNVPFHNCSFVGDTAYATAANNGGGGFYANSGSGDTLANCTFSGNSSKSYGGGFLSNGHSSFIIRYSTFSRNTASVFGGGFGCASGNTFTVSNSHISNNIAPAGGGMYIVGGSPTLSYDTVSNDTATATSGGGGGGLYEDVSGANPTLSHCWFLANVTNGANGAAIWDNAAAYDSNSVFQANIAKGSSSNGGAIYHNSQTGFIINCVFVDNSCTGFGGGYYDNSTGETVEACTFYNNSATAGAGIYDIGGAGPKYFGNITWGNIPDGFAIGGGSTTGFKVKYNDFQAALSISGGSIANNLHTDPLFYNTGSYTGSDGIWATTDDGLHLGSGSPAADFNNGTYPVDDIADVHRPYTGNTNANIGAYEGSAFTLALSLLSFSVTPAGAGSAGLSWSVDAGSQVAHFAIQRSTNGITFDNTATVAANPGQTKYSFIDDQAAGRLLYYRLLTVLDDGNVNYSRIVAINRTSSPVGKLSAWPSTGVQTGRTIYLSSVRPATVNLILRNDFGRPVWRHTANLTQGDNFLNLDMTGLSAGIYYLSVIGGDGYRQTLLLEKL